MAARTMRTAPKGSRVRSALSTGPQGIYLQPSALDPPRASSLSERRGGGQGGTRADRVPPIPVLQDSNEALLLRPIEVAETLGISRSKVFELLSAQELPSVHIGRSTRIPKTQLEEWIESQVSWQPHVPRGLLGRLRNSAANRP